MRLSGAQLDDLKARNPVHVIAGDLVRLRKGSAKYGRAGFTGPCPICSTDTDKRTATKFECTADKWVCATCQDGGDVFRLKARLAGLDPVKDFRRIVDDLGGAGVDEITPAVAERHGRGAYRRRVPFEAMPPAYTGALATAWRAGWNMEKKKEDDETYYRTRALARLKGFWREGAAFPGTPVETYFVACRDLLVPTNARVRFHPRMPYFADGKEITRLVYAGPAMLAAIYKPDLARGVAVFSGLHVTWLDLSAPKGKAVVVDPETGEVLVSKKVCKGSAKAGGYIDLGGDAPAMRLFAGEGVETTLAPYTALARTDRLRPGDAFRAAVDLGNLGGKALATLPHPTDKTEHGRPRRVPGPEPDLNSPAMPVPDTVGELVGLGDGDSDPFLTRNALARFKARHVRAGRAVRTPFAPAGMDFADLARNRGHGPDA